MCPEFVIELRSPSDRLKKLQDNMLTWIANRVEFSWLIDPDTRSVMIYRPGRTLETLQGVGAVYGEGSTEGFLLELGPIWNPF